MKIKINGKEYDFDHEQNVLEMISALGIRRQNIAVAINSSVVPQSELEKVTVRDGDSVEIIQAVQGG